MEQVLNREAIEVKVPSTKISDYYGSNVFSEEIMRKHLSEEAYFSVKASIQHGQKIDRKIADQVAASMKAWAMSKGATHYTHWFQPLTGTTAEKHDSFLHQAVPQQVLRFLAVAHWFSRSLMHPVSRVVVFAAHSKRAVIQHGILPHRIYS